MKQFLTGIHHLAGKVTVRSAVNPMLWLCVVISLPAFGWYATHPEMVFFAWLGSLPPVVAILGFVYFALCAPENLRSEEYQLRKQSIDLLGDRDAGLISDQHIAEIAISNPKLPPVEQLTQPEEAYE